MMDKTELRDIILNSKIPCVIKYNTVPWSCFDMSIEKWCKYFDEILDESSMGFNFETGFNKYTDLPQWERTRTITKMKLSTFLNKYKSVENSNNQWSYFGYKYINECPKKCRENVNFDFLGFPELIDVSFWLGSKGAHTPCHFDTYGCNVVVQVFGRKQWLLFPPNTSFKKTRIPYEESSIYCQENFFSPSSTKQFDNLDNLPYSIILEPGDILIVPPKWWHYVECLETSLNFNTWIPLEEDIDSQISECIVNCLLRDIISRYDENLKKIIINPNELSNFDGSAEDEQKLYLSTLNYLVDKKINHNNVFSKKNVNDKKYKNNYITCADFDNLLIKNNKFIKQLTTISKCNFINMILNNTQRYDSKCNNSYNLININDKISLKFIDIVCNQDIVNLIKKKFIYEKLLINNS